MQNGEKMAAVESLIFQFAQGHFSANGVEPLEAKVIMEAVCGKFQRIALENLLIGMVRVTEPTEKVTEEHSGTAEELLEAFRNTGFIPNNAKGEKQGAED